VYTISVESIRPDREAGGRDGGLTHGAVYSNMAMQSRTVTGKTSVGTPTINKESKMTTSKTAAKSLVDLAKSHGSTATTISGARRYLIARLSTLSPILERNYQSKKWQWDSWRSARIERAATGRARIMGLPMESSDWRMRQDAQSEDIERRNFANYYTANSISISDALCRTYTAAWDCGHTYIAISRGVVAVVRWDTESDWGYYSKSYGRPKNTYSNRRVDFCKIVDGKIAIVYSHSVDSFRGNFLSDALLAYSASSGDLSASTAVEAHNKIVSARISTPWTAYKIVSKISNTEYRSNYNKSYVYRIGHTTREIAKREHGGGLYVWRTIDEAKQALGNSKIYCDGDAIIECRVCGKTIEYGNGKIAVSSLTPISLAQ